MSLVRERAPRHAEHQQVGEQGTRRQGVEQRCGEVANRHETRQTQTAAWGGESGEG